MGSEEGQREQWDHGVFLADQWHGDSRRSASPRGAGDWGVWGRTSPECPACRCHLTLHPTAERTRQEQRAEGWAGVMMTNVFLDKLNLRHLRHPRGKRMI